MKQLKKTIAAAVLLSTVSTASMACVDTSGMTPGALQDFAYHDGVNTAGLDPNFQNQLNAFLTAANEEFGGSMTIYSGYRSIEHQRQLYEAALVEHGSEAEARRWVAPPGNSMHNYGGAVDLRHNGNRVEYGSAASNWMSENLERFGLTRLLGNEGWHVEPVNGRETLKNGEPTDAMTAAGCDPENLDLPAMVLMEWKGGYAVGAMPAGSF
ncbi:MAG: D-alanyl-D-alanine carboxypeptidase family protein [Roseibium sp.]|uniref:D-alanyl-D-alanine carboxypeptidase family protein n=1 Tax=Roseibium sp. TaxID=1936156 RepID=UPI00329901B8